jgi:aryl-alcohol dehydrogenase-like predicted oxidoreductase
MQTRQLGSLRISEIGLGCNNFGRRIDEQHTADVVDAAIESGINFFDTADIYGGGDSERFLGRALGERRKQVYVATKFGHHSAPGGGGGKPAYVRKMLDASLQRLGTDYVDLYQMHQPDPGTPIAETLSALDDLVREGKVREIGCSNFSVEQLKEAERETRRGAAELVSVQNHLSLLHREAENGVLHECRRSGLMFIPYFPLESGLLTGKYRKNKPVPKGTRLGTGKNSLLSDENLDLVEQLVRYAESKGHTLLELAFGWLLAHDKVASVIAGATRPEQARANAAAGEAWRLTPAEMEEVGKLVEAARSPEP